MGIYLSPINAHVRFAKRLASCILRHASFITAGVVCTPERLQCNRFHDFTSRLLNTGPRHHGKRWQMHVITGMLVYERYGRRMLALHILRFIPIYSFKPHLSPFVPSFHCAGRSLGLWVVSLPSHLHIIISISMNPSYGKLRKSPPQSQDQRSDIPSVHWLFRSNIPRRRTSYLSPDIRKRNFFGMGEIIGVLTNVSSNPPRVGPTSN